METVNEKMKGAIHPIPGIISKQTVPFRLEQNKQFYKTRIPSVHFVVSISIPVAQTNNKIPNSIYTPALIGLHKPKPRSPVQCDNTI